METIFYSHNGDYPAPIPFRIRLSNGYTRTDPSTFTEEEILDAGYVKITQERPTLLNRYQKVEWSGTEWILIEMSEDEKNTVDEIQWSNIRSLRDQKINDLMWRVQRYESEIRQGLTPKDDITVLDIYVQALRDITKQEDPYNILWPSMESQNNNNSTELNQ